MKQLKIPSSYDKLLANADKYLYNIQGQMTFFPLCCSTGIIKGLGANTPKEDHRPSFEAGEAITNVNVQKVKDAKYIHEIIRAISVASRPIIFPRKVAAWNALSLCLIKTEKGNDDGPAGGYNNYKAAQIVMCDRIVADKRDKRFKFGSYNIVYSVDQFMDWLDKNGNDYGEFYSSPAVPGGHGARVRSGTFTVDADKLRVYHDERIEAVRKYVLDTIQGSAGGKEVEAADKVAASW